MTAPLYMKLSKAPRIVISYPDCSACAVEVDQEDQEWICPSCGTAWDIKEGEDAQGMLYEEWAGEKLEGPVIDPDDFVQVHRRQKEIEEMRKS